MRKADYDLYADYIEPQPKDVEGLREIELTLYKESKDGVGRLNTSDSFKMASAIIL